MFNDKMQTEPIPARVYSLYKIVKKYKDIQRDELRKKMEPEVSIGSTSYFSIVLNTAMELEIVSNEDNHIKVVSNLDSIDDLRSHTLKLIIKKYKTSRFYKVTKTLISMDADILKYSSLTNPELVKLVNSKLKEDTPIDNKEMLGWRFWAQFLGFGITQDTAFLPNAYKYLKTVLNDKQLPLNEEIDIASFLAKLDEYLDILDVRLDRSYLSLALSSALQELNKKKEISLIYHNDQGINKLLFKNSMYFNNPLSAVVIAGGQVHE